MTEKTCISPFILPKFFNLFTTMGVKKRNDVFDWAKGKNTSIVCFQETHSSKEVEKLWEDEWD
jgi:hypothetical protein